MKRLAVIGETTVALILSGVGAFVAAVSAFFLTAFVGVKVFRGEASYRFGFGLGPLAAVLAGVMVFALLFRKLRFT